MRQFLELALPSWLAPGNLPAVAARPSAKLFFLTTAQDRDYLRRQPEWAALTAVIPVGFVLIDDLIVPRNHATVQTLAWERAIRRYGAELTEIEFMLMLSDVMLADGTLRSIARALADGYRGVMLGGMHVVEEEVAAELRARTTRSGAAIALEPRALVRWALPHLHPNMAASFVNQSAADAAISHSVHPHYLFWRIDDEAIVGRYFLLWTVGVRPENPGFEISGSNDIAFPSEFCPSGHIKMIDDSDDGFFVECAPRRHEATFLRPGPYDIGRLAAGIARWATAQQRVFSATRMVFHAGAHPVADHPVLRESDAFMAALVARLPARAQPHRNHPYWGAQLNALVLERSRGGVARDDALAATGAQSVARRLLWRLVGQPPLVRRLHPFWRDYQLPMWHCRQEWPGGDRRLLIVCDEPHPLAGWLAAQHRAARVCRLEALVEDGEADALDGALLVLAPGQLSALGAALRRLAPSLTPGTTLLLHVVGVGAPPGELAQQLVAHAGTLLHPAFRIECCAYVGGRLQALARRGYALAARLFVRGGPWRLALAGGAMAAVAGLSLLDSLLPHERRTVGRHCSAASVVLRRS